jgi:hypothetical protein
VEAEALIEADRQRHVAGVDDRKRTLCHSDLLAILDLRGPPNEPVMLPRPGR